jgi:hypothetical protein
MTVTYLNAELDGTKEFELFKITPNGFKVTIVYNKGNWIAVQLENGTEIFENATEVHNLFDVGAIAFESDIRATGFVRKVKEIESITIELQ